MAYRDFLQILRREVAVVERYEALI